MNFLAHFHLAWPDEQLVAGGLEGDFYKGPLGADLPDSLARGVQLHRAIDAYTDQHPQVAELRRALPAHLRRFSGIVADLSFDHYLSVHWDAFSDMPLKAFNREVYATLSRHSHDFSPPARQMFARLVEHDILGLYDRWQTVTATAARIGQRFGRRNPFGNLERDLAPHRELIEAAFLNFYPDLQSFSRTMADAAGERSAAIARPVKSP